MNRKAKNTSNKEFFRKIKEMFWIIWRLDKKIIFIVLIETIISATSYFPVILLPKYVIDSLISGQEKNKVILIISIMIGVSLIINSLNILLGNIRQILSQRINVVVSNMLCRKCVSLDYELYNNSDTLNKSYYAYKVVGDNNFLNLLYSVRNLFTNIVVIAGILVLTLHTGVLIVLIAFVIIILQSILTHNVTEKQKKLDEELNPINRKAEYISYIANVITFRKDVLTYNAKDFLLNKLNSFETKKLSIIQKNTYYNIIISLLGNFLSQFYQFSIYVLFGLKVLANKITIGEFSMFLNALNTFVNASNGIISEFINIKKRVYYFDKYNEFMLLKGKEYSGNIRIQSVITQDTKFTIEFRNVSFKYPGANSYALENINIKIRKNEKIAIVGENGAGKTTFIMLLMRLYDPTEGEITVNGINIKNIIYDDYIGLFSTVFQDFQIYGFSVINNIIFRDDISKEERKMVLQYMRDNNMEERVNNMKNGLDTYLNKHLDDDGESISGGEGQKIAIIRALVKNGEILIMDEPTSSLDPSAEYELYKKFADITQNKTAIYISHRLASTYFCDKIIVFEKGHIVECGSHNELMMNNNLYAEMFKKQSEFYNRADLDGIL